MRLFIAINFDEETKGKLTDVQIRLRELAGGGNYTRWENMHLTLAFIGETPPNRAQELKRAMEDTAVPPLTLTFDRAGRFRYRDGDVWWAGLAENPALAKMRRELLGHLAERGFQFNAGEFTPHATLARGITTPDGISTAKILPEPFSMQAEKISLMLSEREQGVLRYTELFRR